MDSRMGSRLIRANYLSISTETRQISIELHVEPESSLLIQLRTGKAGFRQILAKMKVPEIEDGRCLYCRRGNESIRHVLDECPALQGLRPEFFDSQALNTGIGQLLKDPKYANQIVNFVLESKRLNQFAGIAAQYPSKKALRSRKGHGYIG